jgi:cellulose biosynthesis protein BcsQ
MIIVLAQTKGGVGKSTLAINLAIARARQGADVLLVDADEQATAADFTALRTAWLTRLHCHFPNRARCASSGASFVARHLAYRRIGWWIVWKNSD